VKTGELWEDAGQRSGRGGERVRNPGGLGKDGQILAHEVGGQPGSTAGMGDGCYVRV
jgi:hypothetical protein